MIKHFIALLVLLASTAIAAAEPQRYLCSFLKGGSTYYTDFLSNHIALVFDTERGSATAYDAIIYEVHEAPISVKYTKTREGTYRLRWKLANVPATIIRGTLESAEVHDATLTVRYTLQFDPKTRQAQIKARARELDIAPEKFMTCNKSNQALKYIRDPRPPA